MDDTGAGRQPSRAEFEALRRKVEAIDDLRIFCRRAVPPSAERQTRGRNAAPRICR